MAGSRAIFIMSCHALACFTCPEMTRCAFCSTSSTGAHHQESGIYIYMPNKIPCFCGKFCRLGRSRSVLLPALASQGLSSRTGQTLQIALTGSQNRLQPCKILPEYSFHESMYSSAQNAKPRMTPKGHSPAEVQQRVEEFATLISCHNSLALQTQHNMLSRSTS